MLFLHTDHGANDHQAGQKYFSSSARRCVGPFPCPISCPNNDEFRFIIKFKQNSACRGNTSSGESVGIYIRSIHTAEIGMACSGDEKRLSVHCQPVSNAHSKQHPEHLHSPKKIDAENSPDQLNFISFTQKHQPATRLGFTAHPLTTPAVETVSAYKKSRRVMYASKFSFRMMVHIGLLCLFDVIAHPPTSEFRVIIFRQCFKVLNTQFNGIDS